MPRHRYRIRAVAPSLFLALLLHGAAAAEPVTVRPGDPSIHGEIIQGPWQGRDWTFEMIPTS